MNTTGKFIVFEGTDGSGKSTQLRLLAQYLEAHGIPVYVTREPTDSPFGTLLRACLTGKLDADERAIALAFAADRVDHIQNPAYGMLAKLRAGITVLCDRYYFSSFAYNGGFAPLDWVIEINRQAMELLRPDLVIYLDLSAEDAMKRVGRRATRERYESIERQKLIRDKYFEVFERFKREEAIAVVKSEDDREATQARIRTLVNALFGGIS